MNKMGARAILLILSSLLFIPVGAQSLTLVELNCENLFDYDDDEGKDDAEYLPNATRHWTRKRYWQKLNNIAKELLSCTDNDIPDLMALCEVENDSVVNSLVHRSLLRNADYDYVMTQSPDLRGIDVALIYRPSSFSLINSYSLHIQPVENMRPTRDILYACGRINPGDTLHIFVIHAPSRYGGNRYSQPFRQAAINRLCQSIDSLQTLSPDAMILIAGDFNDGANSPVLQHLSRHRLHNLTCGTQGQNGVLGTYRYQGEWEHIDHIYGSHPIYNKVDTAYIHAPLFLLEEEPRYGGYRPRRTYNGMRYQPGYSDHLPLVARFRL